MSSEAGRTRFSGVASTHTFLHVKSEGGMGWIKIAYTKRGPARSADLGQQTLKVLGGDVECSRDLTVPREEDFGVRVSGPDGLFFSLDSGL